MSTKVNNYHSAYIKYKATVSQVRMVTEKAQQGFWSSVTVQGTDYYVFSVGENFLVKIHHT